MEPVTNRRRWTIVLLLLVASMINYFDRGAISLALPLIAKDLSLDSVQKGLLLSAFFWSYASMQVPIGLVADRVNLRWLYAGAFTLWSCAQGLTGFATGLTTLIAFRILLGIGESIYLPGGTKIVSLFFPLSERGLPCGLFDFGTRTGLVMEGVLLPFLLKHFGWRVTFAIIGFTALLWLIPWLVLTPRSMRAPPPRPPIEPQPKAAARQGPYDWKRFRDLFGVCLAFFCFDYYWYLLVTWLPDYFMTVRKLTLFKAGILSSLPFMVFGICQPLGGWLGDHLVRAGWTETMARKTIITLGFLTGLLLIPAARTSSVGLSVFLVMAGCLVGLSTANQLVVLQSCAPPTAIGLWTGIYNFIGNLAGIVAPLATGYLIKWTGSYTPAFVLAALLIAAGQLSYWLIVGKVRSQPALLQPADSPSTQQPLPHV